MNQNDGQTGNGKANNHHRFTSMLSFCRPSGGRRLLAASRQVKDAGNGQVALWNSALSCYVTRCLAMGVPPIARWLDCEREHPTKIKMMILGYGHFRKPPHGGWKALPCFFSTENRENFSEEPHRKTRCL